MGNLRDRWLELEPQIPNDASVDIPPEVLKAILQLHREVEATVNDGASTARERRERGEAAWVLARTHSAMLGDSLPNVVLTRDEVIEHLRAVDEEVGGEQTHAWLVERFNITDAEVTRWMTVTLSRDAIALLQTWVHGAGRGTRTISGERRRALEDEIRQAVANARPEEDDE